MIAVVIAPRNTQPIFVMKTGSTMYEVACIENNAVPDSVLMRNPSHAMPKKRRSPA